MENGEGNLESKFAGLTVSDPYYINGSDGLFQVMKAVEAAEATIKQQVFLFLFIYLPTSLGQGFDGSVTMKCLQLKLSIGYFMQLCSVLTLLTIFSISLLVGGLLAKAVISHCSVVIFALMRSLAG